jgi:hypothetical protein
MDETRTSDGLTPDQKAAHAFLSELRTRISTQPLPYQYGVEARALESLWEVFAQARDAMKKHPGCETFAREVTTALNIDLRPMTAKWHRAYLEGRLNSRDGGNEFRSDLADVQKELRRLATRLHAMAYGRPGTDECNPPPLTKEELDECFAQVPFGIVKDSLLIPDPMVDAINMTEDAAIARRRIVRRVDAPAGMNAVGLGLSGGGVRSATFCLGVTQVLADRDLLKDVDFLSTVSGGGYVGSFLTARLGHGEPHTDVGHPHGPDSAPIRYLRQHAKYLTAIDLKERWSMVTATLAGMILNWTAPLFLLALAALISLGIAACIGEPPWLLLLAIFGSATILGLVHYAGRIRFGRGSGAAGGTLLGAAAALTLFIALCWMLTIAYGAVVAMFKNNEATWSIAGLVAAGTAAFPTIVRFIPILKKPSLRTYVLKAGLLVAGLVIPFGGIGIFYLLYYLGTLPAAPDLQAAWWSPWGYTRGGLIVLGAIAVCSGAVALGLLNVNLTAPHRLYRGHLARTFVQRDENDPTPIPLTAINPGDSAPYHLINTTVNLPSSTHVALRERRGDFFLFSKQWCGAPSTGYHPTTQWTTNDAPADLATAMAVSGAAASSHMGLASMPTLTALLTFLNVRLGFWILRPDRNPAIKTPGFACLIREMTGVAMSEKQNWLNLSDGGHIENMGIYELLRRRCKFIISIDGEADPLSTFQGHLTLVRHAQIDFGVRIDPRLGELRPDLTSKYSQTHSMFCRIHYPAMGDAPAATGLILYIKLSVTGNESELIRRYRTVNADFPHETTLDQFFDEEQFEAYRQLGVHVAEGLFNPALMSGKTRPATVPQWFRQLAENLLEPEGAKSGPEVPDHPAE